jgi:hypothetical protein
MLYYFATWSVHYRRMTEEHTFLLQRVQPAMIGLIDGSLSTLAPIFSVAIVTHKPHYAFIAGVATAIGAGISMAFSEGLSDTGELTGRGSPFVRGSITGVGTFIGGIVHTLPFLIPHYEAAIISAIIVVALELIVLAWLRWRFFEVGFVRALASVTLGGVVIAAVSAALGSVGSVQPRQRRRRREAPRSFDDQRQAVDRTDDDLFATNEHTF